MEKIDSGSDAGLGAAIRVEMVELGAALTAYSKAFGDDPPLALVRNVPAMELAAGLREFVAGGVGPTDADFSQRFGVELPPK